MLYLLYLPVQPFLKAGDGVNVLSEGLTSGNGVNISRGFSLKG